jgi:transcriptional regulator of acetoin/glycerol metabolism
MVPRFDAGNVDDLLVHAAGPVLDSLSEDLAATNVALLLTDGDGDILDRRVAQRSLGAHLDRFWLAPGFVYSESTVGTNAIGTAIAQREPAVVRGSEHFVDALATWACAAVPITDPRSGRLLGVLDLTSRARDANELMLPLARRAAKEIEERLLDDAGVAERVMMRRILRERRGWKGPMLFANERMVITNAAAERVVKPERRSSPPPSRARALDGRSPAGCRDRVEQRHAGHLAVRADPRRECNRRCRHASRIRQRRAPAEARPRKPDRH